MGIHCLSFPMKIQKTGQRIAGLNSYWKKRLIVMS